MASLLTLTRPEDIGFSAARSSTYALPCAAPTNTYTDWLAAELDRRTAPIDPRHVPTGRGHMCGRARAFHQTHVSNGAHLSP